MTIAAGTSCYHLGAAPCTGEGRSWSGPELEKALTGPVADIVFDSSGAAAVADLLTGVAETEFQKDRLADVLAPPVSVEDWRVGEAIAEGVLVDHHRCFFPWPDSRDERKSGSSLPGADLVGFQSDAAGDRFAFGEVKTSSENRYPPQVISKKDTGLQKQIEDLRDRSADRDTLMRYLGLRASRAAWCGRFQAAAGRYLANKNDVALFGVLVRDVAPHQDDLRVRVTNLAKGCPAGTDIALLAIYLPTDSIAGLPVRVLATQSGGGGGV